MAAGAGLSAGATLAAGAAAFLAAFFLAGFLATAFLAVFFAGAFFTAAFLPGAFFTAAFLTEAFLQQQQGLSLLQQQAPSILHSCLGCLTASFLQSDLPQAQPAMKTDTTATRARLRIFLISISLSGDIQSPFGLIFTINQDNRILLLFFRRRSRFVMLRRRSWFVMLRRRSWFIMLRRRSRFVMLRRRSWFVMLRRRRGRSMVMAVMVTSGKHQRQTDDQQISQCLHCDCFLSFGLRVIERLQSGQASTLDFPSPGTIFPQVKALKPASLQILSTADSSEAGTKNTMPTPILKTR